MRRIFLLLLLLPVAYAQSMDDALPLLEDIKNDYNQNIEEVPKFIKMMIGTERINAYISLDDGTELAVSALTEKGLIKNITMGETEDPTLIAHTSEKIINEILQSDDPLQRLTEALKEEEISYQATSLKKKIKWGMSSTIVRIAGWFKKIFT